MTESKETARQRLRRRAEHALERRRLTEAETLLERLLDLVEDGSEESVFAHRHLAELRLERHPWRAALHLRHVIRAMPDDDVPHAMMGLCQALLGNYRAAVGSYRRALDVAPGTPWYLHNLGHLLDVALDDAGRALPALRAAHEMEPAHDEITASLAHCLARAGELDEALELAQRAEEQAPDNADHARLVKWIERGAPDEIDTGRGPREGLPEEGPKTRAVRETFEREMRAAGFSAQQVERAKDLWRDFRNRREVRVGKPEVFAAAVEYAIALIHSRRGATQAKIARRYGIAATSLSSRYGEIRDTLALRPGDPRYAS